MFFGYLVISIYLYLPFLIFIAVVLSFVGEAKVHWSETHVTTNGKKTKTKTKHYRNDESYFNHKTFLFGRGKSDDIFSIEQDYISMKPLMLYDYNYG